MAVEEVVLHLGMGKTGSSALQVAFVRNRDFLTDLGIYYPEHYSDKRAMRGETVTGNGIALQPYLAPPEGTSDEDAEAALAGLLELVHSSATRSLLYSSEMLFYFDVERLRSLHTVLADRGVRLRAMMFVRDVAGHALSCYAQEVKRSRYTASLATYIEGYSLWPEDMSMQPRLAALLDILGADNTVVAHYDTARRTIVESFLAATYGLTDLTGFESGTETVNRSLTAQEVEWMRYINGRLETALGALVVSDQIIHRAPLDPTGVFLTVDEVKQLGERFGDEVSWINEQFPGTGITVEGGATIHDGRTDVHEPDDNEKFLLDCLAEVVNTNRKPRPKKRAQRGGPAQAEARRGLRHRLTSLKRRS